LYREVWESMGTPKSNLRDMLWGLEIGLDPDAVDTFDPRGNVWFLPGFNENMDLYAGVLNSIVGYRHVATVWTVGVYCLTWLLVAIVLGVMKRREGMVKKDEEIVPELQVLLGEESVLEE
jgi:hypothetical protein